MALIAITGEYWSGKSVGIERGLSTRAAIRLDAYDSCIPCDQRDSV